MTDIVERLRAAISLLQADNELLRAEGDISDGLLKDAKAEIERLRAERDDYKQCAQTAQRFAQIKDAEIERLCESEALLRVHIEVLEENDAKLRAALLAIVQCDDDGYGPDGYCANIAKAVLEQKP